MLKNTTDSLFLRNRLLIHSARITWEKMKFTAFSYGKFDFMEKFNSELDVQVKESNRGRIVFIVPAGLMLFLMPEKI